LEVDVYHCSPTQRDQHNDVVENIAPEADEMVSPARHFEAVAAVEDQWSQGPDQHVLSKESCHFDHIQALEMRNHQGSKGPKKGSAVDGMQPPHAIAAVVPQQKDDQGEE
jgi:hypothetical protein